MKPARFDPEANLSCHPLLLRFFFVDVNDDVKNLDLREIEQEEHYINKLREHRIKVKVVLLPVPAAQPHKRSCRAKAPSD